MSDTHQKALEINLAQPLYGVLAEIGAGQEVARWFFRVGGAAGTIAKTISAYDMDFSDAIYGPATRYVSRERLEQMLVHEYGLLHERLADKRGGQTCFFAFADTVAARSFSRVEDTHGWMGIMFQTRPLGEPSRIVLHVRMLDRESVAQQEALGVLGVNFVHAALLSPTNPRALMDRLLDNLSSERVEVDVIDFSGPAFAGVDNRVMCLHLVQAGLSHAAMIDADGKVVQPAAVLYKKPILVVRGAFRPPTKTMLDLQERALAQFVQEPGVEGEDVVVLMEMTLKNLMRQGEIDPKEFLARADMLGSLGKTVLISNYGLYYRLAEYLFGFTQKPIGLGIGAPTLKELFDEKYYTDLPGGILASFGRLFENDLKVYVYPYREAKTGAIIDADNFLVAPHLRHLYAYLRENRFIEPIRGHNPDYLAYDADRVLSAIRQGDPAWEEMVPAPVAAIIRKGRFFTEEA